MIKCEGCGYTGEFCGALCPKCSEPLKYTEGEAQAAVAEARSLVKRHEYGGAVELYSMLADMGIAEAEYEFAEILERGAFVPRDLDRAMQLFLSCAKKNDPRAAYRYSRLASRVSDEAARFWLRYSAVLGCGEAYSEVARLFSEEGREELATYYYYLSAEGGDRDAVAEMALRYYRGTGAPASLPYAKWYLDKFFIPPIYLIRTAYKLRSVKAEEPPAPACENYEALLRSLVNLAEKYKIDTAYFRLNTLLAERGDFAALLAVGASLVEGVGCEQDIPRGISTLESVAAHGFGDAYGYLGSLYIQGEFVARDTETGVRYLGLAGENGAPDAYEILGDMYRSGDGVERNPSRAVEYYELAAKGGSKGGAVKYAEMKRKREDFFDRGAALEDTAPEEAFRAFAISAAMGYHPAEHRLAICYELGVGTAPDRYAAYYWYKSAAANGEPDAVFDLGRCYAYGIGVAFDYKKAIKLFMRSGAEEELVKHEVSRLLERKRRRMVRGLFSRAMRLLYLRKFEPALEILATCERLGHAQGIYTLGCLLEFGFGTRIDRDRAYGLYEKAYKLRFRDPRQTYKLTVLKMVR